MKIDLRRAQDISGWMSDVELWWLADRASQAHNIIEIGSARGRSTRAIADHAAGTVTCIDSWRDYIDAPAGYGESNYQQFQQNLADHITSGKVRVRRVPSGEGLALYDEKPDFIFIDGDHDYGPVMDDIGLSLRLGPALLAGHDYDDNPRHTGVRQAVDEFFGARVQHHATIWWIQ